MPAYLMYLCKTQLEDSCRENELTMLDVGLLVGTLAGTSSELLFRSELIAGSF